MKKTDNWYAYHGYSESHPTAIVTRTPRLYWVAYPNLYRVAYPVL